MQLILAVTTRAPTPVESIPAQPLLGRLLTHAAV